MTGRLETDARPQVLVVDDEAAMRTALKVSFLRGGWQADAAAGKAEALARLHQRRYPLLVTDIRMPDGDGFAVMRAARELRPDVAVILLTAFASVPDAVTAMKSGACEYLVKPVPFAQLLETAQRAMAARSGHAAQGPEIIGSSPALLSALDQARQAALSDADVLIQAESGTGKELLARRIHALSQRRERPFVAVNCAGIPESLLESELFGHGRGAFTGAVMAQAGKFQLADGGTLLLDEIGEMPLSLQPKLLRGLQEREFYRLGETRPVRVNIRVIATTNRPLAGLVREGRFRADLYYRLNVIPLSLPPLRERPADIRELALHFAHLYSPAGAPRELPASFLAQLEGYAWPGNVRELANVVRRAVTLGDSKFWQFPDSGASARLAPPGPESPGFAATRLQLEVNGNGMSPGMSLQAMEKRLLELTLTATCGNRSRAAAMLGVSLRTVRNKIRAYNLPPRREYVHGRP